jgi:Holliday junction DNA helicase RuvA
MISYITGTVQKTNISKESYVDILTNSGIAYRIRIPSTYIVPHKGKVYSLYTHFHVRDDNQSLYGFEKEQERDFFEQLISVSGIGPKIGMAMITMFSRKELEDKILGGDAKSLSKVSGLGMKGAQKIILELRGKIDFEQKESVEDLIIRELKEALKTLGFSGSQLKESIEVGEKVLKKNRDISIEELIKEVLSK